jgi:hypothetical protein
MVATASFTCRRQLPRLTGALPEDLRLKARAWVHDWETWHHCKRVDDEHPEWIDLGWRLYNEVKAQMARYGVDVVPRFAKRPPH